MQCEIMRDLHKTLQPGISPVGMQVLEFSDGVLRSNERGNIEPHLRGFDKLRKTYVQQLSFIRTNNAQAFLTLQDLEDNQKLNKKIEEFAGHIGVANAAQLAAAQEIATLGPDVDYDVLVETMFKHLYKFNSVIRLNEELREFNARIKSRIERFLRSKQPETEAATTSLSVDETAVPPVAALAALSFAETSATALAAKAAAEAKVARQTELAEQIRIANQVAARERAERKTEMTAAYDSRMAAAREAKPDPNKGEELVTTEAAKTFRLSSSNFRLLEKVFAGEHNSLTYVNLATLAKALNIPVEEKDGSKVTFHFPQLTIGAYSFTTDTPHGPQGNRFQGVYIKQFRDALAMCGFSPDKCQVGGDEDLKSREAVKPKR